MAKVTLTNVSSSARVAAVENLSLEIHDREFLVLAGGAGSGGGTIVRMIAGLEDVRSGEIQIGGRTVNGLAPKDRDVAMVFRDGALYPHMTVFENIAFGLQLRKFTAAEIKKRVGDAASILALEQVLAWKPERLSIEQRQRVGLGRAIVRQPKVLLFDHPLAQIEADSRAPLRTEIIKLHQRLEATMIYATNDPIEAMTMADRVVVIADGAIRQVDPPAALYSAPADLVVARFFGRPAMNLIEGTLKQEREEWVFTESGEGTIQARIPAAGLEDASGFIGKPVLLGIRPEAIEVAPLSKGEGRRATAFPALLDLVEPLGVGADLHLFTGAHTIVCRTRQPLEGATAGRRMQLSWEPTAAHLFDPISTRRID